MTRLQIRFISLLVVAALLAQTFVYADNTSAVALEYMERGEKCINNFYDPRHSDYFVHNIDAFFTEYNLKQVKSHIENVAALRGVSTKDVAVEVTSQEFTEMVFGNLSEKLSQLHQAYINDVSINASIDDAGVTKAVAVGAATMLSVLGITAAIIGIYASMTATVTGLWAALIIWWTGSSIGMSAAIAAILAGPWGWIILGGMIVASIVGYSYYKKQAEIKKAELKESLIREINGMRSTLVTNWRKSFR